MDLSGFMPYDLVTIRGKVNGYRGHYEWTYYYR